MIETTIQAYMQQALELAKKGRLTVSPNPMVGCLIVKNKQIIGQGWHQRAGEAHAEVLALREAGEAARGARVFITLEPCCHQGRTPPCTKALIEAGIKEVYVACEDPNPLVASQGIQALREAGVAVQVGLLETQARELNAIFFHYIKHRRPWVMAKWAMSLDGRTITQAQDSRQISGPESSEHTHQIRQALDAILVGARTAIQDNPQLTVRLQHETALLQKQPLRIVLSSQLTDLPLDLKLFSPDLPGKTLLATTLAADPLKQSAFEAQGIEVMVLPADEQGGVHLPALLDALGKREISSLLVEGGQMVHARFLQENLINSIQVYLAPALIGNLKYKRYLTNLQMNPLGNDYSFTAILEGES